MSPEVIALLIGLALAAALAGGGIAIGWRLRLSQVVELEGRNKELERQCGQLAVQLERERKAAARADDEAAVREEVVQVLAEGLAAGDPDRAAADAARLLLGGGGGAGGAPPGAPPDGSPPSA